MYNVPNVENYCLDNTKTKANREIEGARLLKLNEIVNCQQTRVGNK